jgi:hypothetical protein
MGGVNVFDTSAFSLCGRRDLEGIGVKKTAFVPWVLIQIQLQCFCSATLEALALTPMFTEGKSKKKKR